MFSSKQLIQSLATKADIKINGHRPWDVKVHDERVFGKILRKGTLGLGESYMDKWWDVPKLDQFIYKALKSDAEERIKKNFGTFLAYLATILKNFQSKRRAGEVNKVHYDLGNDLYQNMLDSRMIYTCGYWKEADNLDDAQRDKLDLICRKAQLKPGMKILDIGCGFGGFMKYATENYGVECVGYSLSKEQIKYGKESCKGLPIEFRFADYRSIEGEYDAVISIGMFEAVGYKNFKKFMKVVNRSLKDSGLFVLHTIGSNISVRSGDMWFKKYIFPNGMVPSIKQIAKSAEGLFVIEDLHNFSAYYDRTLMEWHKNFKENWPKLRKKYGDGFYRMWEYYLLSCAGLFRARKGQLWQIVFSKKGLLGGYDSVR